MKTKRLFALLLTLCLVAGLCGCGGAAPEDVEAAESVPESAPAVAAVPAPAEESAAVTVADMIGREVEIVPGSYKQVVCIGAGALRMYCYVGDTALLCGVEDIDNVTLAERPKMFDTVARPYMLAYGDTFAALPSCGVGGPQAQTAEAEKILSCEPDIVISEYEDVEKADALQEQLGVPVITLKTGPLGAFNDSFYGSMELLGQVFGREERAAELVSFVKGEAEEISSRTADIPEDGKPGVYICGLGNWGTTNHLMTSQNYISFDIAHVRNVVSGLAADGVQPLEEEMFAALGGEMDIVIADAAAIKNCLPLYGEDPHMLDTVKAWETGEVYLQMAYNAYYTNYEISVINTWFIAKTVYPELFEDIDMTAKTDEVTEAFLGKPLAEEIFACPASYGGYGKLSEKELA